MCLFLFVRVPVEKAAIWSLLGGYLLLPSGTTYDVPFLPPIDKYSVTSLSTFLACYMKGTQAPPPKRSFVIYCLAFIFVISPIFTSLNNGYELRIGDRSLPGFYPIDALKYSLHNLIVLAPFFVGLRFLSSDAARLHLLRALPAAAIFYSLPILVEVRLSPQFHRWVYGYFPHDFSQTVRDGGFRPVVFLSQGLEVALFVSLAVIAAAACLRAKVRILGQAAKAAFGYLAVILLLCKTLGAAFYALLAAPIVLFTKPKAWLNFSCAVLLIVCAYPMLRSLNLVPVEKIAAAANAISADRSSSFRYRIANETLLLAKANEKALFGWGTWGRSRVYEDETGQDIATTDGTWIIQYGMFGWFGYLSLFLLFAAAVLSARATIGNDTSANAVVLGGLGLLLAVNVLDLLPNSALLPTTFLLAGCVAARARVTSSQQVKDARMRRARRPMQSASV